MAFLNETTNTSFSDFITAFRNFAATVGFGNTALIPGGFSLDYNGYYWNFLDTPNTRLEWLPSTGQNTVLAWNNQPGHPTNGGTPDSPQVLEPLDNSMVQFYLFGDAPSASQAYVHAALEIDSGDWLHMHIGGLDKWGTYGGAASTGGGEYSVGNAVTGAYAGWNFPWHEPNNGGLSKDMLNLDDPEVVTQNSEGFVKIKIGTINCRPAFDATGSVNNGILSNGWWEDLYHFGQISWSGLNPMFPIFCIVPADSVTGSKGFNGRWRHVGQVPDIRFLSMEGLTGGDIIVAGGDNWHVFPVRRKGLAKDATQAGLDTGFAAYAYREIP